MGKILHHQNLESNLTPFWYNLHCIASGIGRDVLHCIFIPKVSLLLAGHWNACLLRLAGLNHEQTDTRRNTVEKCGVARTELVVGDLNRSQYDLQHKPRTQHYDLTH